jgi:hypothetical protein
MAVLDPYLTPAWTNQLYANVESASGVGSAAALGGAIISGFNAWTFDPAYATNDSSSTTGGLTTGTVYLSKIFVPAQIRVTNVSVYGVAAGSGNAFTGLYNAYGTLLGTSAGAAIPTTAIFTGAQTTAFQVSSGIYYAAVLQLTTGAGTLGGLSTVTGFSAVGLTVPTAFPYTNSASRFLINATSQTTLPAQLTATNATATSALGFWAGLS